MPNDQRPPSGMKSDPPRRFVDVAGTAPRRGVIGRTEPDRREPERNLIVGHGISLNGEIKACDHLVVEGTVEAELKECRAIEIAAAGTFKGSAEIEQADIAGRFEGDLTVRGKLVLRSGGVVSGSLTYGEIEIETGGKVIGSMEPIESVVTPIREAGAKGREEAS